IWRHRGNIANLLAGKESRIGGKAGPGDAAQAKGRRAGHRRII
ncbi:MAG: glycerol-3-phosphate acyltransferase, partial [Burkholderiaceae bacterium]|nr:glycerol-3-phosphate acyltransferase [Burkholderiaceae bacterium]